MSDLRGANSSISPVDGGGLRSIRVAELEVGDWVKVELGVGNFFSHSHTEGVDIIEFFGLVERVKCLGCLLYTSPSPRDS